MVLYQKKKAEKHPSLQFPMYNRGLGYSPIPKITITGAQPDPPTEFKDSNEEEFHEMPFEYLDDIFHDAHVNTITPVTPNPSKLKLLYPELIDWGQKGKPALDICTDDGALLALLSM